MLDYAEHHFNERYFYYMLARENVRPDSKETIEIKGDNLCIHN